MTLDPHELLAFGGLMTVLITIGAVRRGLAQTRSRKAGALPDGEEAVREAADISTRYFVEQTLAGRRPGRTHRSPWGRLVLSQERARVAAGAGLLVEVTPERGGEARCVGPRRLVIEGRHTRGTRVRVEMLVDDAEGWAQHISAVGSSAD